MIDIEHEHRQRLAVEGAAGAFALVDMLQPTAVEEPGEGVDLGVLFGVENDPVALAHPLAEQLQEVLHHLRRLLEQRHQGLPMQAQHAGGLAGHHIGRGVVVVDETDLAGTLARLHRAHRAVFQRAEVDLQAPCQHQVEILVAVEGR
ncbi:hypothetical protein D3C81_1585950 [compost metagenome]